MNWCGGGVSWCLVECVAGVCANDAVPHHRPARRPPYHPVANGRGAAHEGCTGTWDGPEGVGRGASVSSCQPEESVMLT